MTTNVTFLVPTGDWAKLYLDQQQEAMNKAAIDTYLLVVMFAFIMFVVCRIAIKAKLL